MDRKELNALTKDLRSLCCGAQVKAKAGRWWCVEQTKKAIYNEGCGKPCSVRWAKYSLHMGKLPPLPIIAKADKDKRESSVVQALLNWLRSLPECKAEKTHGGMYGKAGKPDITGCYKAMRFEIEAKRPVGGVVSKVQEKELAEWAAAGCHVAVARSLEELQTFWRAWGWM